MSVNNMIGKKYGKLTVLKIENRRSGHITYSCLCDCGNTTVADGTDLRRSMRTSCGCAKKDKKNVRKHILFIKLSDVLNLIGNMSK